uniref:Uncharacterized protein n=1 Tax=Anas platyrhynchos platyrhynchos TaxID=8840 RepID=A0A493TM02_ANAPP
CHYLCFIETDFNTSALNFLHSASTLFVRYCEMCRNGVFFFFFITIPFVSEAAWVHLCPSSVAPLGLCVKCLLEMHCGFFPLWKTLIFLCLQLFIILFASKMELIFFFSKVHNCKYHIN